MFDLAEKRLVWIPIVWKGLVQKDPKALAEPVEFQIEVLTEIVGNERLQEIFGGNIEDDDTDEEKARKLHGQQMTNLARFKALVSDWRHVRSGGQEVSFEDQYIDMLLKKPNFALGFDTSYLRAYSGQIELAEKNSDDSSGSGQPGEARQTSARKTKSARKPRS
jgi:hypothetical protein